VLKSRDIGYVSVPQRNAWVCAFTETQEKNNFTYMMNYTASTYS